MNAVGEALSMQIRIARRYQSRSIVGTTDNRSPHASFSFRDNDAVTQGTEKAIELAVRRGETFYLAGDIFDLVVKAAETIPDEWTLLPDHFPELKAFVAVDVRDSDEWPISGIRKTAAMAACVWAALDGSRPSDGAMFSTLHQNGDPNISVFWKYGSSLGETTKEINKWSGESAGQFRYHVRFMASLLSFLNDRILVKRQEYAPRAVQHRNASRAVEHEPVVSVIELRRREYETVQRDGEAQHRDYSVQWIVRGHWRNQWYPSLGRHQPKWITPYVKGPEDKPLKTPRANVFAVVR